MAELEQVLGGEPGAAASSSSTLPRPGERLLSTNTSGSRRLTSQSTAG